MTCRSRRGCERRKRYKKMSPNELEILKVKHEEILIDIKNVIEELKGVKE